MSLHIFGVKVKSTPESKFYFDFVSKRAAGVGLHRTLATWYIYKMRTPKKQEHDEYLIAVKTALPDAWLIGGAIALVPLIFTGLKITWWLLPPAVIILLSFFTTSTFRFLVVKMALRRWDYHGEVTRLRQHYVLLRLIEWGNQKY